MEVNPLQAIQSLLDIVFKAEVFGAFIVTISRFFFSMKIVQLIVGIASYMFVGTLVCSLAIMFLPRFVEDYIRLYNWYLNSDFYDLFARKVDIRPVIVIFLLPLIILAGVLFALSNLVVSISYRVVFKVFGLKCFYCGHKIIRESIDLQCVHCGTRHCGTVDEKCPLCGFKPNAVQCTSCAHLVFTSLEGSPPNPNIIAGSQ
jgi:hypothetical protein